MFQSMAASFLACAVCQRAGFRHLACLLPLDPALAAFAKAGARAGALVATMRLPGFLPRCMSMFACAGVVAFMSFMKLGQIGT